MVVVDDDRMPVATAPRDVGMVGRQIVMQVLHRSLRLVWP